MAARPNADHAPRPPLPGAGGGEDGPGADDGRPRRAALGSRLLGVAALVCAGGALAAGFAPDAWFASRAQAASDPAVRGALAAVLGVAALLAAAGSAVAAAAARAAAEAGAAARAARRQLAIAADGWWELDAGLRLVGVGHRDGRVLGADDGLGRAPWELPRFQCDPAALDALRADLDARAPLRDRLVHWLASDGRPISLRISGEPRHDARGGFAGYVGVARDVSAELAAQRALDATETRYEELFARIPSPLVLHRRGRVVDANPAALALLGCETLQTLLGHELLGAYESGESRERERRRFDELDDAAPGSALPVAAFRLQPREGLRLAVRSTSVRVDADGGPATLSIYVDDTEREASEETLRRSEAVLAHLVAGSPDLITLTDLATGRFTMANDTFARVTGHAADAVVGRTAVEIDLWHRDEQRARFVERMQRAGTVSEMPAEFRARDGRVVQVRVSATRFRVEGHDYLVVNARDVTESERSRREREAILDNASIGIAVVREGRFVLANRHFEQLFGAPPGGLVERGVESVWGRDAPLPADAAPVTVEREAQRRDGSVFVARVVAQAVDAAAPAAGSVWIVEDVTERREAERRLAAARDAAEAASRAKSSFLANTNHELRNPLNGLLHLAKLAADPALAEPLRRQYLDQIAESAQALAAIVSDILDVSKIEAGRMELAREPFDLAELLRGTQRVHATIATARGLALQLEIGDGLDGAVLGDALRVRQIVTNFVGNALKFTATGGVRVVARRMQGGRVRIEVHDSGPGIDAPTQARLFQPFTQADASPTRRHGGTGLGLAICRELAALMGGEVGLDSQPGVGSVFWAQLPLPRALGAATPAATVPAALAAAPRGREVTAAQPLAGARVLLAEDNPVNAMIGVALLERWGAVVEQAADGRQAVDAVERAEAGGRPFDAVLMDVQMPVMSGYEATRALRHRACGKGLPIIALTAAALVSERDAAAEAGMDDFLTKPIDADRLRETLTRWVRRG